jgi:hypothetical protein
MAEGNCKDTYQKITIHALSAVKILQCLYVDDRALIFTTRADLKKGLELVCKHFARFGLEKHIGRGNSPYKTECVFFPPPGFFYSHLPALQQRNTNLDSALKDEHEGIITDGDMHNEENART